MADCERCQSLLDLYMDHELEENERLFVQEHLKQCPACQAHLAAAQQLEQLLRQWAAEEIEPPPDFREKLFARLEAEAAQGKVPAVRARKKFPALGKYLPWAAAAILLIALLPAVMHLGAGQMAEQQTAQVADADQGKGTQEKQAAALEAAPPSDEAALVKDQEPPASTQSAAKQPLPMPETTPAPAGGHPAEAEEAAEQPELSVPEETGHIGEQTPLLASTPQNERLAAPAADEQPPAPRMMYRASSMGEVDWDALKEQADALKQQLEDDLSQLRQQNEQAPTDELAQTIAEKEAALAVVEAQREAIAAKDWPAYESAGEPTQP